MCSCSGLLRLGQGTTSGKAIADARAQWTRGNQSQHKSKDDSAVFNFEVLDF
jgi:hypothetical protein